MLEKTESKESNRRGFVKRIGAALAVLLGGGTFLLRAVRGAQVEPTVWQIDPLKCNQCGRCADNCVQAQSAVRCVHQYELCGYCKLCFGYFRQGAADLTEDAENQNCPTGALIRKLVEEPYYEYTVNEQLCIGCGKCIKGCTSFGNGSLFLQVRQEYCLNCNQCSIALNCPAGAFGRIPGKSPYMIKRCHE